MAIPAVSSGGSSGPPMDMGPTPPTPVYWGKTYVGLIGRAGEGEEIPLTGFINSRWPGIIMQPGATGLDAPPYELHSDDSPNLDGGIFRDARAVQREIMIPVVLYGQDRQALKALQKRLIQAINPKRGPVAIKAVEGDGVPRYLYCYYKAGMEGSEDIDSSGFRWKKFGLQFTAYDPYWYSDTVEAAHWTFGVGDPFLSTTEAFFPLHITAGVVSGSGLLIDNPGDVEAWPTWTLSGPIKSFNFVGPDGHSFGIPADPGGADILPDGRTLVIDTRPGYKTLMDDQGTNYWPLLDSSPQLWPIPEGVSECTITVVSGSTNAEVQLTFRPRYMEF